MSTTVELRVVEEGGRSSLYVSRDGALHRFYHDTRSWKRIPMRLDEKGVQRFAQNRRVEALIDDAFGPDCKFRGEAGNEGGSTGFPSKNAPPHVRRAAHRLGGDCEHIKDVETLASEWNVKVPTAWCYLCQVTEHYPRLHLRTSEFVHPNVIQLMRSENSSGSLRDVWDRFDRGDPEMRCLDDLFAHLRLGRLCVQSEQTEHFVAA